MSFWEDLSPSIKGYLGIAAALIVLLLVYRSCASGPSGGDAKPTSTRGYQGAPQQP